MIFPDFAFSLVQPVKVRRKGDYMQKSKINNINVYAGIHTVMVRSGIQSRIDPAGTDWINVEKTKWDNQNRPFYYYILNLNRYARQDLWTQGEFMAALFSA